MRNVQKLIGAILSLVLLASSALTQTITSSPLAYVQGTWTPIVTTDATVGTPSYTTQFGSYEQIGRQVTVRFQLILSGWTGSPTGNVQISGLPVTSANTANDVGICVMGFYNVAGLTATNGSVGGFINPNTTVVLLRQNGPTSTTSITAAQAGTTPAFAGSCTYHN